MITQTALLDDKTPGIYTITVKNAEVKSYNSYRLNNTMQVYVRRPGTLGQKVD